MGNLSFRRFVIPSLVSGLMFVFSSCNQAPVTVAQNEPTLTITSQQKTFRKGDNLTAELEIYSPTEGDINIFVGASDKIGLTKNSFQVTLQAGQRKTIQLQGTIKRAGYYNITANATGSSWHEPTTTIFGFNAQTNDVQRAAANTNYPQSASGVETLEAHLDSLPKIKTLDAFSKLSTAQTIDDAKDLDAVRLDARLENLQFEKRDGTKTEPLNTILNYLPDTGSGKPRPEDLVPPTAAQKAKPKPRGIGCGASTTATVNASISYNGKTQILPNTKISVWDDNPWLNPSYIASGFTDASGNFRFQKPDCDWGAWWDYSGVDIFFIVEATDNHDISVRNIWAPYFFDGSYGVRTGTNWDTGSNNFSVNLGANNSDSEHAIWLYRMVQMAQDFNVDAGGAGATYFPIRIAWPTRLNPLNWVGISSSTSYAPVAKLEIFGSEWLYPYIAWHEFGHNMMYRTANPGTYSSAYNFGAFSISIPNFAIGTHYVYAKQNVELAYNEGFANFFYVMLQDYYDFNFNAYQSDTYYFRNCVNTPAVPATPITPFIPAYSCDAYASGIENESRVSTFLYRYTQEVLKPVNFQCGSTTSLIDIECRKIAARGSFGLVRSRLWNVGYYNTSFSAAWINWLKSTLPSSSSYQTKTKDIATSTYFSLVIP
jgi:hypothetical protein